MDVKPNVPNYSYLIDNPKMLYSPCGEEGESTDEPEIPVSRDISSALLCKYLSSQDEDEIANIEYNLLAQQRIKQTMYDQTESSNVESTDMTTEDECKANTGTDSDNDETFTVEDAVKMLDESICSYASCDSLNYVEDELQLERVYREYFTSICM